MIFKRISRKFRDPEKITRFKLVKSGKRWIRVASSSISVFKGRVKEDGLTPILLKSSPSFFLKGIITAGAIMGATSISHTIYAEDKSNTVVEYEWDSEVGVVGKDSLVLGVVKESLINSIGSEVTNNDTQFFSITESNSVIFSLTSSESESGLSNFTESETQVHDSLSPVLDEDQDKQLKVIALDINTYIDQVKDLEGSEELVHLGNQTLRDIRKEYSNPSSETETLTTEIPENTDSFLNAGLLQLEKMEKALADRKQKFLDQAEEYRSEKEKFAKLEAEAIESSRSMDDEQSRIDTMKKYFKKQQEGANINDSVGTALTGIGVKNAVGKTMNRKTRTPAKQSV